MQLRAFQAVLSTGSFAKAGAELGFTASAVSQQVAALERTTGLLLFERGPRSVRPTGLAHALGSRVSTVLAQLDGLEREVTAMAAGGRGIVRIGSFPTASAGLLPGALARLTRSQAGLEVLLDEAEPDDLVLRLEAAMLDVILVYEYYLVPQFWPSGLQRTTLLSESLVLLVDSAHPLAARDGGPANLAELAGETWAASLKGTAGARSLDRLCAEAGFAPRVAYRSNDYNVIRGLVSAGLGVALVPELAHADDPRTRSVGVASAGAGRRVIALHRKGDTSPALVSVLRALAGEGRTQARSDRRHARSQVALSGRR